MLESSKDISLHRDDHGNVLIRKGVRIKNLAKKIHDVKGGGGGGGGQALNVTMTLIFLIIVWTCALIKTYFAK